MRVEVFLSTTRFFDSSDRLPASGFIASENYRMVAARLTGNGYLLSDLLIYLLTCALHVNSRPLSD